MRANATLAQALSLLAPPRCGACADPCRADDPICRRCATALARTPSGRGAVAGIGAVVWAAPYQGVARELVTALKFGGRLGLAPVLADAIARALGAVADADAIVAVPAAPLRARRRGFDPATAIAAALADAIGLRSVAVLKRANGPRQVGRRRDERLRSPPRVWIAGPPPRRPIVVDDVLTTGATLAACAAALRGAGAVEVRAAVFARALGEPTSGA